MRAIPISAAECIAELYGYDQVIIIARKVGEDPAPHGEHCTTYGRNKAHCDVAARCGEFLTRKVMGWQDGPDQAVARGTEVRQLREENERHLARIAEMERDQHAFKNFHRHAVGDRTSHQLRAGALGCRMNKLALIAHPYGGFEVRAADEYGNSRQVAWSSDDVGACLQMAASVLGHPVVLPLSVPGTSP